MGLNWEETRVLRLFADMLDYPTAGLAAKASECEELVSSMAPEALPLVRAFRVFAEQTSQGRLEEIYTGTFDLDAACHPYVGYQLLGESYVRSVFLLKLKDWFREQGFPPPEGELPDRLSVLLRFLSISTDESTNDELLGAALLPALDKMTKQGQQGDSLAGDRSLYQDLLLALRIVLAQQSATSIEQEHQCAGGNPHVR